MEDLISVVVPIYKVEDFIKKCVDSILNQTYKNLEIILVDDGSPDKCGEICDEYKKIDNRIIVIHKDNGGLSDARNVGISIAKGKYISVIDSDDWIESNMIEILYKNIINYKAEISICGFIEEDTKGNTIKCKEYSNEIKVYSKYEALNELIIQSCITNHAWNKLYKKDLFENILYPKGQLMEDISTTYKLFEKTNYVVYQSIPLYHYIQRNSSILGNITKKRILDQKNAFYERNSYLAKKYPQMEDIIDIDNIENLKAIYYLALLGGFKEIYSNKLFSADYKKCKKLYCKYKKKIRVENRSSMKLFYSNRILYKLYVLLKKKGKGAL